MDTYHGMPEPLNTLAEIQAAIAPADPETMMQMHLALALRHVEQLLDLGFEPNHIRQAVEDLLSPAEEALESECTCSSMDYTKALHCPIHGRH